MSADGETTAERASRTAVRRLALAVALAVLVLDQATKLLMLEGLRLATRGPVEVAPFLEFVLVWNPGISYGLFPQDGALGRWTLVAFTVAASAAIGAWLLSARTRFTGLALALVLGGAIGNLIDRVRFGAVVDFVHFHVGTFSWYVFNVADAAIVVGVALVVAEAVLGRRDRGAEAGGGR